MTTQDNNEAASAPDLRAVLIEVQKALKIANETPGGPICDTIWMPTVASETLFDFIEAALEATSASQSSTAGAAKGGATCPDCHGIGTHLGNDDGYSDDSCDTCDGSGLAHVARQRQESEQDATEAAELQTLLMDEFACYRPTHPAGLMAWARIALLDNSPHRTHQPELTVWYGTMPESNGKSNFTALLMRKGGSIFDGITLARSEYPERVRYDADCVRYLIGELAEKPWITDYDGDKHSGYVPPAKAEGISDEQILQAAKESGSTLPFMLRDDVKVCDFQAEIVKMVHAILAQQAKGEKK